MRLMTTTAAIALAAGITMASGFAYAVPSNSNAAGNVNSASYVGNTVSSPTNLSNANMLTFGAGVLDVTSIPPNYQPPGGSSNPNTFFSGGNTVATGNNGLITTPIDITGFPTGPAIPDVISNFIKFTGSAGTYTFDTSLLEIEARTTTALTLEAFGTLIDGSGTYSATAADAVVTIDQAGGSGSAISSSFSFSSPPSITPNIPEPASLSILGIGLLGLGAVRRRFRKG